MGKLSNTAIASMFALFLVSMLASAFYTASEDATKEEFEDYGVYENRSDLNVDDLDYNNSQSTVSNLQLASEAMANKIADAQTRLNSNDITEQLLGAFGILSALTIDVIFLMLAMVLDGINFVSGIATNLGNLESPWDKFAVLGGFGVAIYMVYMMFKIASAVLKWDV